MPVLPAVDSTTSPPGLSSPRFSASRIIHLPARSFTDWPGFMNSALPRMVQPVASEARESLMSGVLPMASTTSLLNVMCWKCRSFPQRFATRNRSGGKYKPAYLSLLCEDDLPHVDVAGQEARLAIGEIILPQPPEAVVESQRLQVGPGRAKIVAPGRQCLGIIFPENALAD